MSSQPTPSDRVAYWGRVSTPDQKLEHQRESVLRWCERSGVCIPEELRFEEHIRRHQAAGIFRSLGTDGHKGERERTRFDDLMQLVKGGKIDWIVVATFDRFGIQDQREIFSFTLKLREYGVRLYSVEDNLDLTSADVGHFFQVAAKAVGSVGYTTQQAEKNIQKMIHMSEGGWATSGNVPYGLDLVLYSLHDLTRPLWRVVRTSQKPKRFKVVHYSESSRVERDEQGVIVSSRVETLREEELDYMPPRNKKTTGYRCEPSICTDRTEAVKLMFELAERGFGFGAIADKLFEQGFKHFGKRFGTHAIEVALGNPAYIGMPAWGKNGVGKYRRNYAKQAKPVERKQSGPITVKKDERDWVFPRNPVFAPIIEPELFASVKAKLQERRVSNPAAGKVRTRNKATHPLNGKLFCPDCNKPMVLGSFCPGTKTNEKTNGKARRMHCFVCGTYRKTNRTECFANTVSWANLDVATAEVLKLIASRLDAVEGSNVDALRQQEWLKQSELGRTMLSMAWAVETHQEDEGENIVDWMLEAERQMKAAGIHRMPVERQSVARMGYTLAGDVGYLDREDAYDAFDATVSLYTANFSNETIRLRSELAELDAELESAALELPKQTRFPTVYRTLTKRIEQLEARKAEIEPKVTPLTVTAENIRTALKNIRETITQADRLRIAQLLDTFVERVEPIFEVKKVGQKGKRRTEILGFRFISRADATCTLPDVMKISLNRMGTGSSRRRG